MCCIQCRGIFVMTPTLLRVKESVLVYFYDLIDCMDYLLSLDRGTFLLWFMVYLFFFK